MIARRAIASKLAVAALSLAAMIAPDGSNERQQIKTSRRDLLRRFGVWCPQGRPIRFEDRERNAVLDVNQLRVPPLDEEQAREVRELFSAQANIPMPGDRHDEPVMLAGEAVVLPIDPPIDLPNFLSDETRLASVMSGGKVRAVRVVEPDWFPQVSEKLAAACSPLQRQDGASPHANALLSR